MILWRATVRELARQLDGIDVSIHRLVAALEQLDELDRGKCGRTGHEQQGTSRSLPRIGDPPPDPPPKLPAA
jgi:hypothetical protein